MDSALSDNLENNLELLVETSRTLGIMVTDFQPQNQKVLNDKIQAMTACLKELDNIKDNFKDIMVPTEVFEYIDDGKNPLLYTKDCLMKTLKKNEEVKGKIDTISSFRDMLLNEFSKTFPQEFETYKKLKEKKPDANENQ